MSNRRSNTHRMKVGYTPKDKPEWLVENTPLEHLEDAATQLDDQLKSAMLKITEQLGIIVALGDNWMEWAKRGGDQLVKDASAEEALKYLEDFAKKIRDDISSVMQEFPGSYFKGYADDAWNAGYERFMEEHPEGF